MFIGIIIIIIIIIIINVLFIFIYLGFVYNKYNLKMYNIAILYDCYDTAFRRLILVNTLVGGEMFDVYVYLQLS